MRAYYGNGLNYQSKPLSPAEIQRAVFRNEASRIRAGALTGETSAHECPTCGAALTIVGANRSGTIWRRCTGENAESIAHDDYEPTTTYYLN